MSGRAKLAFFTALIAAVSGAAVAAAFFSRESPLEDLVPAELEPLAVPVRELQTDDAFLVALEPVELEVIELFSPIGGTVSDLKLESGANVTRGEPVMRVGRRWLAPMFSPRPMADVVRIGEQSSDVEALQGALVDFGLLQSEQIDGTYGSTTARAVTMLRASLSLPPNELPGPNWFLWINGAEEDALATVGVEIGGPVVAGQMVASMNSGEPEVLVLEPPSAPPGSSDEWQVDYLGSVFSLHRSDGSLTSAELHAALQDVDDRSATVSRVEARSSQVIPASSVLIGVGGQRCVIVRDEGVFSSLEVTIVSGSLGFVEVADQLATSSDVVTNPVSSGLSELCD